MTTSRPGTKPLTESAMRWRLRQLAKQHGSQEKLAQHLGISPQFLSDILQSRRPVSKTVAAKVGYRREVIYVERTEV